MVVLGRRELGAILLGVAAIVFYLVLLSTTPSGAQTGGSTTNRTTNQNQYNDQNQITTGRTTSATIPRNNSNQGAPTIINVPNKPLPPSGGLPVYGVVAGAVLAGAGLLTLGLGIRRGTQGQVGK